MAKTFSPQNEGPLLDIASLARGGPRERARLTPAQVDHVRRTVSRVPEVMVKVLARNSSDFKSAKKHLDYIGRYGELELEGNDGERWQGRIGQEILENWSLDLAELRPQSRVTGGSKGGVPKLVHKLLFSMPPGTPPDKVLRAVRSFAREEFGLKHRYVFVLHTDEPHPHVHMLLKATGEKGDRLNIKRPTLRHWRSEFARHLRLIGVEANATERAVRGQGQSSKKDGIYRAGLRGKSTYLWAKAETVASELLRGMSPRESGKRTLVETRKKVTLGWVQLSRRLTEEGRHDLAADVHRFVAGMLTPRTDLEQIAEKMSRYLQMGRSPNSERVR